MKTQLHKTQQGFIVTSDEKPLNLGFDTLRGCLWNIEQNSMNGDIYKRVIAQQHQLDFSAISEEWCKRIGYYNLEELANGYANKIPTDCQYECSTVENAVKYGFQTAQELLSDRVFTLEQAREIYNRGSKNINYDGYFIDKPDQDFQEFIQSLTPTAWEITGEFVGDKYRITEIK